MDEDYNIGLKYKVPVNFTSLEEDILRGRIHSLGIFTPEQTDITQAGIIAKTVDGNDVHFGHTSFYYHFKSQLVATELLYAMKSALELAKKLEGQTLSFNPNKLSLYLGVFKGKEDFERGVGSVSKALQERLFGGGSIGYIESSNDFGVLLGIEEETQKILGVKKLEFEGTAKPAASLDELLARIERNKP